MGIKNLLKFLSEFPGIVKNTNFNNYYNKKIAIDVSILLYQVVIAIRNSGSDLKNKNGYITSHILGLFNKTIVLLKRNIIPIYVFDGKPPELKSNILSNRKDVRIKAEKKMLKAESNKERIKYFKRTVNITNEQYKDCCELLELMGIPYIISPEEADSQCAWLSKNNLVDGVLTEDMDILTFGSNNIIRNLSSYKKQPNEIKLKNVLESLCFNQENFVDFCILLGCDYSNYNHDIKPNIIYKYYLKNDKNYVKTICSLRKDKFNIVKLNNYDEIKNYFLIKKNFNIINKKNLMIKKPKIQMLLKLLVNKYGLVKYKINSKINFLNNYYNDNLISNMSNGCNLLNI